MPLWLCPKMGCNIRQKRRIQCYQLVNQYKLSSLISTLVLVLCIFVIIRTAEGESSNYANEVTTRKELKKNINQETGETQARFKRRVKLPSGLLPEFSSPIGNVTAVLGRDVRLLCQVENLGQYQVAWLKEETKTILSIDTNIIITNYRIFLIPDEEEKKWALHIKDVQESDRGSYQCQLNTSPMRSISGYLEVVVPPSIISSQTSQMAEVDERSNVTVQCRASGHPKPSISWRREDGAPIRLNGNHDLNSHDASASGASNHEASVEATTEQTNVLKSKLDEIKSERLSLHDVDKLMAGVYVCTVSNGIPVPVSKRVPIYVKYQPKVTVRGNYDSVQVGDQLEVDCLIEAFPKPNVYWTKRSLSSQPLQHSRMMQSHRQAASSLRQLASDQKSRARLDPTVVATTNFNRNFQHQFPSARPISGPSIIRNPILTTDSLQQAPSGDMNNSKDNTNGNTNGAEMAQTTITSGQVEAGPSGHSTTQMPSAIKSPISVKHSTIDSQTYKLTMTINRLKQSDFGEYTCIAINSNGQSDASVTIDSNSKDPTHLIALPGHNSGSQQSSQIIADVSMQTSADQPIDMLAYHQQQQQNTARQRLSGHRIYDEKYLEAIKARQSGNNAAITPSQSYQNMGKSQQKLHKLRVSERNSGSRSPRNGPNMVERLASIMIMAMAYLV